MEKADIISLFTLLVSSGAIILSIISYRDNKLLAIQSFNRNYRPYVLAGNFNIVSPADNKYHPIMNILSIRVLNAPALIISEKVSFFIRENDNEKFLFENPVYTNILAYPINDNQMTINTGDKEISHDIAANLFPKKLIRKVYLIYTWISKEKENYFFELESEYDCISREWKPIKQSAN